MKTKKILCVILAVTFVLALVVPVHALEPLHGWYADNESDLKEELEKYIAEYPKGLGEIYGADRNFSLKYKPVLWPEMTDLDFTLGSCKFAEVQWGSGADYFNFYYAKESTGEYISVTLNYWYDDVNFGLNSHYVPRPEKDEEMTTAEGVYKDMPYCAWTYNRNDGVSFYSYNLIIGDVLVNVRDCEPFTESRIDLIQYEETEFMLPVYVQTNEQLIAQREAYEAERAFYNDINTAIEKGLVPEELQEEEIGNVPYETGTTRADFCVLTVRLYEKVTGEEIAGRKTFDDTDDINVEKAAYIGVVLGIGDGKFSPDSWLNREQAATMLSRLADILGKPLEKQAPEFADNDQISGWAFEAAGQVQAAGIMIGVGENRFAPKWSYSRGQSIVTILRLYNFVA